MHNYEKFSREFNVCQANSFVFAWFDCFLSLTKGKVLKMKKSLFAAALMSLVLAACGGQPQQAAQSAASEASAAASEASAAASEAVHAASEATTAVASEATAVASEAAHTATTAASEATAAASEAVHAASAAVASEVK